MDESNSKWEPPVQVVFGIWALIILATVSLAILHKNHYDKTISAPIIGGIVTLTVGVIAAYFGARTALRAAQKNHENNLELQRQRRESQIRGVIQAIYAELTTLAEIYRNEFSEEWEKFSVGESFSTYYPITQDYFTVYNSNAALIGQIPDDELRAAIVKAYALAKGLIDSHLMNNRLLDDYADAKVRYSNKMNPQNSALMDDIEEELKSYSSALESSYLEANAAVGQVLHLIEASKLAPQVEPTTSCKTTVLGPVS